MYSIIIYIISWLFMSRVKNEFTFEAENFLYKGYFYMCRLVK